MANTLRRVLSGLGSSRKGTSPNSANKGNDRESHASQTESIAQLLPSKDAAKYILGDLENGTGGDGSPSVIDRELLLHSSPKSGLISPFIADLDQLAGAEHTRKLDETLVQLPPLLIMENQRLNGAVNMANGEVKRVHSALEETKLQFANFMKERFGLSQRVHRLDEENKRLQDHLAIVHQDHKIFHENAISQLREELKNARLTLEDTASEHNTTLSKLRESQSETATLKEKLEDNCRRVKDLETNLVMVKSQAEYLTGEKAKFDKLTEEHVSLQKERRLCQDKLDGLEATLASQLPTLEKLQNDFDSLSKQKDIWQGRIDTLSQTVLAADRRSRMLNHLAGRSLDVRQDGLDQPNIRRGRNKTSRSPSQEVVQMIEQLNTSITDVASVLMPHFLTTIPLKANIKRCKMILGDWTTSVLLRGGCDQPWFLRSVIQVFLVDWCRAIIEAWYPQQKSFSELLISELVSHKRGSASGAVPFQLIQMMSNGTIPPDLQTWSEEVLRDLLQILPSPAPGLTSYSRSQIILPKLIQLCRISYSIRLALAEEDICGNLQMLVYPPDTPFGQGEMNVPQVVGGPRAALNRSVTNHAGDIAGTIGIGLREVKVEKSREGISLLKYRTLLPPSVILARDVQASVNLGDCSSASNLPAPLVPSDSQRIRFPQSICCIACVAFTCLLIYYRYLFVE